MQEGFLREARICTRSVEVVSLQKQWQILFGPSEISSLGIFASTFSGLTSFAYAQLLTFWMIVPEPQIAHAIYGPEPYSIGTRLEGYVGSFACPYIC